jgi:ferredoxin-like protein FixX
MASVVPQVVLPFEDFALDLENLGRANGNIYRRKQAVLGFHDGQVMIRLKKKRFIILDYTITPNEADLAYAETNPHVEIPKGAGRNKCKMDDCTKNGIPVKLYDSEPNEVSLECVRCFGFRRNDILGS